MLLLNLNRRKSNFKKYINHAADADDCHRPRLTFTCSPNFITIGVSFLRLFHVSTKTIFIPSCFSHSVRTATAAADRVLAFTVFRPYKLPTSLDNNNNNNHSISTAHGPMRRWASIKYDSPEKSRSDHSEGGVGSREKAGGDTKEKK